MSWTDDRPGDGDLSGVDALATALDGFTTDIDGYVTEVNAAIVDVQGAWTSGSAAGSSSAEWHTAATGVHDFLVRLGTACDDARSALTAYSAEVGRIRADADAVHRWLDADRVQLAELRRTLTDDEIDTEHPTLISGVASGTATLAGLADDRRTADVNCLSALAATHPNAIDDGLVVSWLNSLSGNVAQGLGAELLSRYRTLLLPKPGSTIPDVSWAPPPLGADDVMYQGKPYRMSPNGLLLPESQFKPPPLAMPDDWGHSPRLVPDPGLPQPSSTVKWGGRALGAAGAALTVWGAYSDQYDEDITTHPDWSDSERIGSATTNAVVVGGLSAAGGWGGAVVGAELGAAIGSVFPGPGTLIGGIVGGVIGGVVGSGVGQLAGEAVKSAGEGIANLWNSCFG